MLFDSKGLFRTQYQRGLLNQVKGLKKIQGALVPMALMVATPWLHVYSCLQLSSNTEKASLQSDAG